MLHVRNTIQTQTKSLHQLFLSTTQTRCYRAVADEKIIMLRDFPEHGFVENDTVLVKRGYMRNFLYPRKYAIYATKENLDKLSEKLSVTDVEHLAQKRKAERIRVLMKKIKPAKVQVGTKPNRSGPSSSLKKPFTAQDMASTITNALDASVSAEDIIGVNGKPISGPINAVGTYDIEFKTSKFNTTSVFRITIHDLADISSKTEVRPMTPTMGSLATPTNISVDPQVDPSQIEYLDTALENALQSTTPAGELSKEEKKKLKMERREKRKEASETAEKKQSVRDEKKAYVLGKVLNKDIAEVKQKNVEKDRKLRQRVGVNRAVTPQAINRKDSKNDDVADD
ncbi:ribosomal protein L9 [Acrasis kona]|uniref:Ribosomal protein L9 n=1 Tax=Acrasis kona TaxID=1008807 RepID=A0AAW2ZKT9_9EUKA